MTDLHHDLEGRAMDRNPSSNPEDTCPEREAALATLIRAPSRAGVSLAAGTLAGTVIYCVEQALQERYGVPLFCSPFLVGGIVGLLTAERPIRNALSTIFIALFAVFLRFGPDAVYCLFLVPLVLPQTILGALCGWTVRRYVHARRVRVALGSFLLLPLR